MKDCSWKYFPCFLRVLESSVSFPIEWSTDYCHQQGHFFQLPLSPSGIPTCNSASPPANGLLRSYVTKHAGMNTTIELVYCKYKCWEACMTQVQPNGFNVVLISHSSPSHSWRDRGLRLLLGGGSSNLSMTPASFHEP